jgi:L-iditol 2-dehydrogenase
MKALVLEKPNHLVLKQVERPILRDGEVLIRVKACAICGSDVHGLDDRTGRRHPPIIMGHEASGIVEEVHPSATAFKPGERVIFNSTLYCGKCYYCRRGMHNMCVNGKVFGVSCDSYRLPGAMAEYIAVPERILYRIPNVVSFEQAALVEPFSIALHAIGTAEIKLDDTAVVLGAGTIGALIIKLLRHSSCGMIIAVDIDDAKLEFAEKNGASYAWNPSNVDLQSKIMESTRDLGADIAFEAVGIPSTTKAGMECLRKSGTFVLVGNLTPNIEISIQKLVLKQLRLAGSYAFSNEAETSLKLLADKRVIVDDMISAKAPLEDGPRQFERLRRGERGLRKVILTP